MEKIVSQTIDAGRFPLALFVIFIHSVGDANAPYYNLRDFISHDLFSFVVPTFFIFSGYLFFLNINKANWYKNKLKKRVKTLLFPYILWNTITLLLDYIKYANGEKSWVDYSQITFGKLINISYVAYNPIDLPLWYVRDLMILCLLTPFLCWLGKRKCFYLLLIPLYFLFDNPFIISPVSLVFFSIGMYFGMNRYDLIPNKHKACIGFLLSIASLILFKLFEVDMMLKIHRLLMPFVFIYAISKIIECNKVLDKLILCSKYSEIIYYSHYPITLILSIKIFTVLLPEYSLINYILIPFVAAAISMVMGKVIKNITKIRIR